MSNKIDTSVAYLVKGHWSYEASEIEKFKAYKAAEYQMEEVKDVESTIFELWFIFTNSSMPKETSKLSWESKANLPSYIGSNDPEVKKAFDDIGRQNQWRDNITTSLGMHEDLHKYIPYKVHGREKNESKIGFWRKLKVTTSKKGYAVDNLIEPSSKEYAFYAKQYRVKDKKPLFLLDKDKKYLYMFKAFVVDEIIEIRKSELNKNGDYSLYDITKTKKLIRKGNVYNDEKNENEKNVEREIKNMEKAIIASGAASRISSVPHASSNYSGPNSYHSTPTSEPIGTGKAWMILIVIIIIIMFIIFSPK